MTLTLPFLLLTFHKNKDLTAELMVNVLEYEKLGTTILAHFVVNCRDFVQSSISIGHQETDVDMTPVPSLATTYRRNNCNDSLLLTFTYIICKCE